MITPTPPITAEGFLSTPHGKIWYQIVGEKSSRPPLLTLHGGPGFPHDYLQPLAALATDRQVIFYDQLGCGLSDRPDDLSLWTLDRFTAELDEVQKQLNLGTFHLLGQSWGGMLALNYAAQHENLKSLILASPLISSYQWLKDINAYRKTFPLQVQGILAKADLTHNYGTAEFSAATQYFYDHHVCRTKPKPQYYVASEEKMGAAVYLTMWGPTEFICEGNLEQVDLSNQFSDLNVPTLITCGRFDGACPDSMEKYAKLLKKGELIIYENSSHSSHIEEEEKYLKDVGEFLKKHD